MAAFFIATSRIKNPDKFQQYGAAAGRTLAAFGGEMIVRGKVQDALVGSCDHQAVGVVRFPDMDALNSWYRSGEYQALVALRDEAVDMTLLTYAEPA